MTKTAKLKIEPQIYPLILTRFRHAEFADLNQYAGNHSAMVQYLAKTNDLTTSEASDILADCLTTRAVPIDQAA